MATEATGQAYVSPTERVSPPITSTVDTTSTDRRTIKLPSFRTMLAMVEDVANKPCESSMNSGTKFSGSTPREQYHRLPTPRNNVENHVAARLPSQLSERYAESQINDAKMGIDVLATAAVSISSANGSGSLPHLTPLSEFSVRGAPSHSMQPPAYVLRQSYSHQQHPPQKDEEVGLCLARSRKVTPSDGREHDARHNWRPW
ncbi:hypothetical protein LPJ81_005378 [Coemansia sp. IMI 209127]|nr:hypothetical protein LPJ81_005378 [Coemansia sp. IMI 209127]